MLFFLLKFSGCLLDRAELGLQWRTHTRSRAQACASLGELNSFLAEYMEPCTEVSGGGCKQVVVRVKATGIGA